MVPCTKYFCTNGYTRMIGMVANMTTADCSTSGVDSAALASERLMASCPLLSTMLLSRYCSGCRDFVVM